MERPSWDECWLEVAAVIARRATCRKRRVGVVLVRDNRVVSTGYNGAPAGQPHCLEEGCDLEHGRCVRAIHAEDNAVSYANPLLLAGATAYIHGGLPCYACARRLANVGIARLVATGPSRFHEARFPHQAGPLLERAGVAVEWRPL